MEDLPRLPACVLKLESSLELERLAALSGFSARSGSKITPRLWIRSLAMLSTMGRASLSGQALCIGLMGGRSVSRQAAHARCGQPAVEFLSLALAAALGAGGPPRESLGAFGRVLLEDSTSVPLPSGLAGAFPGSSNAGAASATLKIHATYELISRRFESLRIGPYLEPDQKGSALIAERVGPGDLVVRDLGYYSLEAFEQIGLAGARYLSRLHPQSVVKDLRGARIDLLGELRRHGTLDREVLLGHAGLRARLIAFPVPPQVADERRRRLRRKGRKENATLFALQGWTILVTNAGPAELTAQAAAALYRQRWAIETVFKSWKSGLNLSGLHRRASLAAAQCHVLMALILSCLAQSALLPLVEGAAGPAASPLKLASALAIVTVMMCCAPDLQAIPIELLRRHCLYEKRSRPNMRQTLQEMLS